MKWAVILGLLVVFLGYSLLVFADARGWGLPKMPPSRAPRFYCHVAFCRASFCEIHGRNRKISAVEMLKLHEKSAHADEDDKQLWPDPLPPRRRDFTTREARVMQDLDGDESNVVFVSGVKVKVYRGGKK